MKQNYSKTTKKLFTFSKTSNPFYLLLLILLLNLYGNTATAQSPKTYTSNSSFMVPAGITTIKVDAWGAGADGSEAGGGGGGAFASNNTLTVTPGTTYQIIVGTSSSFRNNLQNSSFGTILVAAGAQGVSGGTTGNSIGAIKKNGGDGGGNVGGNAGGGGGGSAGDGGDGENGRNGSSNSSGQGGDAGPAGTLGLAGANGGNGGSSSNIHKNGLSPGAGGGQGRKNSGIHGRGADGQLIVTWACPTYVLTSPPNATTICGSGTSTITLTSTSLPAGTYTVTYSTTNPVTTNNTATMVFTGTTGAFTTTTLSANSTIKINALSSGNSPDNCSNTISTNNTVNVTVTVAPSAPATAAPHSPNCNGFTAQWSWTANATKYYLDVATDNAFTNIVPAYNNFEVVNVTSYALTGLNPATTYYYRVRAFGCNTSANSATMSLSTSAVAIPGTASPHSPNCSGFTAQWSWTAKATNYFLDVAIDSGFTNIVPAYNNLDVANATSYALTGLNPGTTYYYRVRASGCGTSANSTTMSYSTSPIPTDAPVAKAATNIQCKYVQLNFSTGSNVTGVYLDIARDNGFTDFLPGYNSYDVSYNNSRIPVNNLPSGTLYYRLRGYNNCGVTTNSNTISFSTTSPGGTVSPAQTICSGMSPADLTLTEFTTANTKIIKWQKSSDATFSNPQDIINTSSVLSGTKIGNLTANTFFRAVIQNQFDSSCIGESNYVLITVSSNSAASLSISESKNSICVGESVTFTATHANSGATPIFQWTLNDTNVGTNSTTYTNTTLTNGDKVACVMTSNTSCGTGTLTTSNVVTMTVNATSTPKLEAINQPTCVISTGSVQLSGLPATGTIIQTGTVDATYPITTTTISGLIVGTYNFSVSNGSCTSPLSDPAKIVAPEINTWKISGTNTSPQWDKGKPNAKQILIFDANYDSTKDSSLVGDLIEGCSCEIKAGVKVTIGKDQDGKPTTPSSQHTLSIINGLTFDDEAGSSLTFENNSSLWQENDAAINKGKIIYKRKSSFMKDFDYTYWSSPVDKQNTLELSPSTQYDKFYSFKKNAWVSAQNIDMIPMVGYIIRTPRAGFVVHGETVKFPYAQPMHFKGVPNNGLYEFEVDRPPLKNLIGNPYPSAIDAKAFLGDPNNAQILEGTIYIWTHNTAIQLASGIPPGSAGSGIYAYTSDDYAAYNASLGGVATTAKDPKNPNNGVKPSGMIAAGQSFMAKTKATAAAGQKVIFKNSMRVQANNTQFFKLDKNAKTESSDRQRVWLNLTNTEGAFKQTLIGYAKGATNGYEDFYDGIINNSNSFVNFYSINDNKKLVIQGRALPFEETDTVPLGYSSTIVGDFSISIDAVDGDLTDKAIFIEDKETKTIHNLKSGPYTFNTKKGTFDQRFALRYTEKTLGSGDFETIENSVVVTIKNKQLRIHSAVEPIDKVLIYDILGRELYKNERVNINELTVQNLNSSSQTLVVKVILENGTIKTQKVIY